MKEIIEHWGPAAIVLSVCLAIGLLINNLIGTDSTSVVGQAFSNLIAQMTPIQ